MKHIFKHVIAISTALMCAQSMAQSYPSKPVKIVVPFPAGSQTDMVARIVGVELERSLGQPFIIENKPEAAGAIAATSVAGSVPDGSTLLLTTAAIQAMNESLYKKPGYDPISDFSPISRLATTSMMLMTRPDFPANTAQELIAIAKEKGDKLSAGYGSSGAQIALALMQSKAGTNILAAPYKGIPNAATDVIGNNINFTFVDVGNALRFQQGNQLKPIAIASKERSKLAPDVPSLSETLPGYDITSWYGLVGPKNLPPDTIQKISSSLEKSLKNPEVVNKLAAAGVESAYMPATDFNTYIKDEVKNWAQLVNLAGIEKQ